GRVGPEPHAGDIARWMGLAPATLVATRAGELPAEWLQPGDAVLTRDHGYRPLLWVGRGRTAAPGDRWCALPDHPAAPDGRPPRLAPRLGVLLTLDAPLAGLAGREVLAAAGHLATPAAQRSALAAVALLLATHEIVLADGLWVETLPPRRAAALPGLAHLRDRLVLSAARPRLSAARAAALCGAMDPARRDAA